MTRLHHWMALMTGCMLSGSIGVTMQMQTSSIESQEIRDALPVDNSHRHRQPHFNRPTHHRQKSSISSTGQSEAEWFDALEEDQMDTTKDSKMSPLSELPNGMQTEIIRRYIKSEPFTRDQLILAFKSPLSIDFVHEALISGNPDIYSHLPFVIMSLLRDETRNHVGSLQTILDHPNLVYFGKKLYKHKEYIMDLHTFSMVALSVFSGYRGPNDVGLTKKARLSILNQQPFIDYVLKLKDLYLQANGSPRTSSDGSRTSLDSISDNLNALDINLERDSSAPQVEPHFSVESGRSFDKGSASLIIEQFLVWGASQKRQDIVSVLLEEHVFSSIFGKTEFSERELELAMIQAIKTGDLQLIRPFLRSHVLEFFQDLSAVTQVVVTESAFEVVSLFMENEKTRPLTQILLQINDGAHKLDLGYV